jgi:hypothetical protein
VRAASADAAGQATTTAPADAIARLRELARDRDRSVRARAVSALGVHDAQRVVRVVDDPAAEVRAAYAVALGGAASVEADADLRALIDDRDPDVRAAAWGSFASDTPMRASPDRARLAAHAVTDPAAEVRRAALAALDDDDVLAQLAASDDAPEVRTAAVVQLAGRRGRTAAAGLLLARLAAAPTASADRVRIALTSRARESRSPRSAATTRSSSSTWWPRTTGTTSAGSTSVRSRSIVSRSRWRTTAPASVRLRVPSIHSSRVTSATSATSGRWST